MFDSAISVASTMWDNFHAWHPAANVLYVIIAMSVVSAVLVTRIISTTSLITIPASFLILYYAAMFSNFAALSIPMVEVAALQKAVIFTILGHFVGGMLVLGIFRAAAR